MEFNMQSTSRRSRLVILTASWFKCNKEAKVGGKVEQVVASIKKQK